MSIYLVKITDKLDIYRVLPPQPPAGGCSPELVATMLAGRLLDYGDVKTPDDRKLIMLSWIYDVNFPWTLRQIIQHGYIERLFDALAASPPLVEIRAKMEQHLANFLQPL